MRKDLKRFLLDMGIVALLLLALCALGGLATGQTGLLQTLIIVYLSLRGLAAVYYKERRLSRRRRAAARVAGIPACSASEGARCIKAA